MDATVATLDGLREQVRVAVPFWLLDVVEFVENGGEVDGAELVRVVRERVDLLFVPAVAEAQHAAALARLGTGARLA